MSPSSTSFAETVATLRYATRARCIVNMPVVNLDSGTATIRSLKKEVAALRRLLCDANVSGMNGFSFVFYLIFFLFVPCVDFILLYLRGKIILRFFMAFRSVLRFQTKLMERIPIKKYNLICHKTLKNIRCVT